MPNRFQRLSEGMQGFIVSLTLGLIVFGLLLLARWLS
jgi:hypothetical protein